ncbi:MAG TPA: hypothetical protein H9987_09110 [Candidatus Luteococcus avicola]|nr:hypothetical protein [Candidatus Luteococcus avicola]
MDFTTPDASSDTDGLATAESIITVFRGWIMQATVLAELPPRERNWPYGIEPLIDLTGIGHHPPRVSDWAAEPDASSAAELDSPEKWTMRTPFFGAVHYVWHPSDTEFALGHPCIVESADATSVIACYTSRHGMHHPIGVGDTEHYVRLTADEFIERSRHLLASPWSGFRNEPPAEVSYSPLERWSDMFPHGIPDDLQRMTPGNAGRTPRMRTSHGFYRACRSSVRLGSGSDGRVSTRVSHLAMEGLAADRAPAHREGTVTATGMSCPRGFG